MITKKIVIYQLFPRLFGNDVLQQEPSGTLDQNGCGKFKDINDQVLNDLIELGISHIWLTGIIRHATGTAYPEFNLPASHPQILKGLAGSPYAIKDYYDIDPDLAISVENRMDEFEDLIKRIHQHGMKVLIDFVPNHVSRDYQSTKKPQHTRDLGEDDDQSTAFSINNNFYYLPEHELTLPVQFDNDSFQESPAKATGNDRFSPTPSMHDWYETIKLNYGLKYPDWEKHFDPVPDTWKKMTEILRFWSLKGVDGFRCDMAGMVPIEFWHYATGQIREDFPAMLFIAELYEPRLYREFIEKGGFDFLYDKVGLYDCLRDIIQNGNTTQAISRIWENLDGLDKYMLRFMENHDEQRIASEHFAGEAKKGLPAMALCSLMNLGPVMLYNGQELGEKAIGSPGFSGNDGRTSIFDYCSMPELQKWRNNGANKGKLLSPDQKLLRENYTELFQFAGREPEIQGQFYDLMWQNQNLPSQVRTRIYAFLRYIQNSLMLIVISFDEEIKKISIRIPNHALEMADMSDKERFFVSGLYPGTATRNLMLSQVTGTGVPVSFNQSGWTAIRIT